MLPNCPINMTCNSVDILKFTMDAFPCSMLYDVDAGHSSFLEDVYECQGRIPGGSWDCATVPWADVVSETTVRCHYNLIKILTIDTT